MQTCIVSHWSSVSTSQILLHNWNVFRLEDNFHEQEGTEAPKPTQRVQKAPFVVAPKTLSLVLLEFTLDMVHFPTYECLLFNFHSCSFTYEKRDFQIPQKFTDILHKYTALCLNYFLFQSCALSITAYFSSNVKTVFLSLSQHGFSIILTAFSLLKVNLHWICCVLFFNLKKIQFKFINDSCRL